MHLYVSLLATAALYWAWRILRRSGFDTALIFAVGCAALAAVAIVPIPIFAQREHLMVIFTLPYIIHAFSMGSASRVESSAIGAAAALGFALKPYFLVIPIFIVLIQAYSSKSFRAFIVPVHIAMGCVGLAYILFSYIFHASYFTEIIPLTRSTYGAFDAPLWFVTQIARREILLLIVGLLIFLASHQLRKKISFWYLFAAALGALVFFLVQSKGWQYQLYPMRAYSTVFLVAVGVALFANRTKEKLLSGLLIGCAGLFIIAPAVLKGPYSNNHYKNLATFFDCPEGERSFLVLGANVSVGYPLANYADALPATQSSTLWPIPGLVRNQNDRETQRALDAERALILADFKRVQPQLVIVDIRPQKPYFDEIDFNFLDFMMGHPEFEHAFRAYKLLGTDNGFDVYRSDAACPA